MLYNVRIFGKRYRNKTKEDILVLFDKYVSAIEKEYAGYISGVKYEINGLKDSTIRLAFFNHNGKVIFSINKVK